MEGLSNILAGPASIPTSRGALDQGTMDSAAPQSESTGKTNPRFRTPVEIFASTSAAVPWVCRPWVATGSITEIAGKVKLAGKTTFVGAMLAAVLQGKEFLGEPTLRTSAVWLTEQPVTSFLQALSRAGLNHETGMAIQFWHEVRGTTWPEIVTEAAAEAHRRGAGLLIIDTLGQFAGLRGDSENFSGDAMAAVEPLQMAASSGLAIIVTRHERKGGGDIGDSARGSSAFTGAVDIVLALRRPEGAHRPTIRVVHTVSRFDGAPPELYVDFDGTTYRSLGSDHDVVLREVREGILRVLASTENAGLRLEKLLALLPGARRTAVQRALESLAEEGLVSRSGQGRKGDAFAYFLNEPAVPSSDVSICPLEHSKGGSMNARQAGSQESGAAGA